MALEMKPVRKSRKSGWGECNTPSESSAIHSVGQTQLARGPCNIAEYEPPEMLRAVPTLRTAARNDLIYATNQMSITLRAATTEVSWQVTGHIRAANPRSLLVNFCHYIKRHLPTVRLPESCLRSPSNVPGCQERRKRHRCQVAHSPHKVVNDGSNPPTAQIASLLGH